MPYRAPNTHRRTRAVAILLSLVLPPTANGHQPGRLSARLRPPLPLLLGERVFEVVLPIGIRRFAARLGHIDRTLDHLHAVDVARAIREDLFRPDAHHELCLRPLSL